MKKIMSAVLSAAIAASAALPFVNNGYAVDDIDNIVVLGDSIAAGYGLSENEHNYGEIIGDYYKAKTDNFAKSGDETKDLISKLEAPSAEMSESIKNADYVVISIGGNDLIHYASNYLLNICANVNVLKSGYTKDDIPDNPTFEDINRLIDRDALKEYASANPIPMNSNVQKLRANICEKSNGKYDCVIQKSVIPNIEKIDLDIKALNPDTKIVYQTIYDPLQFESAYYDATYTGETRKVMNLIRPVFAAVADSFRDQLNEAQIGDSLIADVYYDFTSEEKIDDATSYKYSWYFTKMQNKRADMDFHPTQAGHVAIAAKVIDTIGTVDKGGDLIVQSFNKLADKDRYPAVAYATYKKVADTLVPEETTTTTTESTTTTASTTTSVTTTTATTTEPIITTTPSHDKKHIGRWYCLNYPVNGIVIYDLKEDGTGAVEIHFYPREDNSYGVLGQKDNIIEINWYSDGDDIRVSSPSSLDLNGIKSSDSETLVLLEEYILKRLSLGDINNDSAVDAKDASNMLSVYALASTGKDADLTDEQKTSADINYDGHIDAKDASQVLVYYSYLSTGGTKSLVEYLK